MSTLCEMYGGCPILPVLYPLRCGTVCLAVRLSPLKPSSQLAFPSGLAPTFIFLTNIPTSNFDRILGHLGSPATHTGTTSFGNKPLSPQTTAHRPTVCQNGRHEVRNTLLFLRWSTCIQSIPHYQRSYTVSTAIISLAYFIPTSKLFSPTYSPYPHFPNKPRSHILRLPLLFNNSPHPFLA